jgi:hypothetical protein
MEYMYQPPSMLADMRATPFPPEGTEAGETVNEAETGF